MSCSKRKDRSKSACQCAHHRHPGRSGCSPSESTPSVGKRVASKERALLDCTSVRGVILVFRSTLLTQRLLIDAERVQ